MAGAASRRSAAVTGVDGYAAALETVALFTDVPRSIVELRGRQAVRALNGLASNSLDPLLRGRAVYSFLLDRKGRVVVDLRVLPALAAVTAGEAAAEVAGGEVTVDSMPAQSLWLDVDARGLESLEAHLTRFVPPMFAEFRRLDVRTVWLLGPKAGACLEALQAAGGIVYGRSPMELKPLEATTIEGDGGFSGVLVRREEGQTEGFDLYLSDDRAGVVTSRLREEVEARGGALGDGEGLELLRIENGIPALGSELGSDRLAQEAGQDHRAISFEKGCFTGQEVVARVHYRGHVNRHLRGLRLTSVRGDTPLEGEPLPSSEPPPPPELVGRSLSADGKQVGTITSAARSPRFGPIALAYVRREIEPGTILVVSGAQPLAAEVVGLPFT